MSVQLKLEGDAFTLLTRLLKIDRKLDKFIAVDWLCSLNQEITICDEILLSLKKVLLMHTHQEKVLKRSLLFLSLMVMYRGVIPPHTAAKLAA